MFNYKTMLVYESELVADVAELEIVAESGCESIKASVLWRRVESRTTVHSTMNSSNGNNNNITTTIMTMRLVKVMRILL